MTARRAVRLAAAVLALAALTGADGGCQRDGVDSDRPPDERKVDPRRERIAFIRTFGNGPYTVLIIAQEVGKTGIDRTGPLDIAAGEFKRELRYTSGLRINIKVQARGHSNDRFHCQILDGPNTAFDEADGQVNCDLTTNR